MNKAVLLVVDMQDAFVRPTGAMPVPTAETVIPKVKELATNHNSFKCLKNANFKAYPVLLIPMALLGLFLLYGIKFNDFLAYFHSGDNIHLFFPPFQIFNYSQPWVNTHWLEEIIFIYLIGMLGIIKVIEQKNILISSFLIVFFISIIFVSHRDLMRYSLPVLPFLYAAFADQITSKEFKIVTATLLLKNQGELRYRMAILSLSSGFRRLWNLILPVWASLSSSILPSRLK